MSPEALPFDDVATMPVALGTIAGRYALQHELGAGGMGAVFAALDLHTDEAVAVKIMGQNRSTRRRARFFREAQVTLSLDHPNIVRVLDFGVADGHGYFQVLELLLGETLADRMQRGEPIGDEEVLAIVRPVLSALQEAHERGLVHRDLTPTNIFLAREGARVVPKLIDFGIVRELHADDSLTQSGACLGTPAYMAPEQIRSEEAGPATDFWALGVIIHQLVCGRYPFEAKRLGHLYEAQCRGAHLFPKGHPLEHFVRACLSFDPAARLSAPALLAL